ncbi:B-cell receptor CD22-like [Protopterus annectens]|uniref:B-cell receptor CD22-like n=1 Tax=Protopterus annectens TaxID=7888 RepID=UPI001CFA86BB|nr:B-cell receptor CD22-like [Protopterus annectens]
MEYVLLLPLIFYIGIAEGVHITVDPEGIIKEGDNVKLNCSTEIDDPEITGYEWRKHSRPLWKVISLEKLLRFEPINEKNAGKYACCVLKNDTRSSSNSFHLDVLFAPKDVEIIQTTPENIIEGGSMNLSCNVGRSKPEVTTYTWYINKVKSDNTEKYLFIEETEASHSGTYRCKAHNKAGVTLSPKFEINVMYPPKEVEVTYHPVSLSEGKDVYLTCNYKSSNPPVTNYTWYKEDEYLWIQTGNMLKFANISSHDTGSFSCEAHNAIGSTRSLILSLKLDETPTLLAATEALIAIGISVVIIGCIFLLCIIRRKCQGDYPIMQSKENSYPSISNTLFKQKRNPEFDVMSPMDTSSVIAIKYMQRNF